MINQFKKFKNVSIDCLRNDESMDRDCKFVFAKIEEKVTRKSSYLISQAVMFSSCMKYISGCELVHSEINKGITCI